MRAHPVLLQRKYARIVMKFSEQTGISVPESLDIVYHSDVYTLMSEGVSDFHCMSDGYLVEELIDERQRKAKEALEK